jgi:branched-chain amino acid transport system substrate-binding protein
MRLMKIGTVVAVAATAALAAGCSSSSSTTAAGAGTSPAASSGSSTPASAGTTSAAAKAPIKLMVDTTMTPAAALGGLSFPYPAVDAKAAAAALNKDGGIDGHQVVIDVCDNQGNPNQSAACGRQAKTNGDIAVIGSWDVLGAAEILPVLQAEGIPYIGALAASPAELTSPDSFIFDPGAVLASYATAAMWSSEGCKNVVEFTVASNPAVAAELAGQQKIAAKDGFKLQTVNIQVAQADVTAPVSTALALHPDCITYEGDGQTTAKLVAGVRQAGYTGKFITAIGSLLPQLLASLGKVGDGVLVLNTTLSPASTDPLVTQFRNEVTAYVGNAKDAAVNMNEFGQDAWSSVRLVDLALSVGGASAAAALLKKLPTMCDVNVGNVYPHVSFCKPSVQSTVFPRIFNTNETYFVAKNGAYVPVPGTTWHDVSADVAAGA